MSSQDTGLIGITGATGSVGGMVARQLSQRKVWQRLIVRDLARAPQIPGSEVVRAGGYIDTSGMTQALEDVETLFLVSGHLSDDRVKQHMSAVDAALAAGVKRIVYLSFLNAAPDAAFHAAREHYRTEEYIRASGAAFTFLRSSYYASSAARMFGADGVARGPAGNGRVSCISPDDIADVAAVVLTSPGHEGKIYNNTGPEALSLNEIAALLTEITGRECRYHEETMQEARESRAKYDAADWVVELWISTYTAIANGELDLVSDDIPRLTGHPAQSLREFLLQHPECYEHLVTGNKPE